MISLFMVPILMYVWITSLEFLTVALRLTLFSTLGNAILWYMRHLVSCRGIEVDKAKIDVIASLPYPILSGKCIHFLGM